MSFFRGTALAWRFAERCERRSALLLMQETISQALQSKARGEGPGPSDAQFDRLAAVMAASQHADDRYLRLLGQATDDIIASAKASARSRG